jgi:hypothetical protein
MTSPYLAGKVLKDEQPGCIVGDPSVQRGVMMLLRYVTSTLVACAFAGTVSLVAQQPPASPAPKEDTAKATLTGCVMEAKTTDGATAYILDNTQGGSAKLYLMLGSSPSDFATNVNKKVEVTGPVREPSPPAGGDAAPANPKALRPPVVQVESVKVVAESCK